ncbi:MAG: hypothetical protein K8T89_03940 [Planctomycetes bacterium]|nr:hypothetical protein [Planctomycetota bacterium]
MQPVRLVTLAPGHFHAALIQKEMLPGIDPSVHVYSPLDSDLAAHLNRIVGFNSRAEKPTSWKLDIHTGDDWPQRFLREKPGNVVVLSGRNRDKIDNMRLAVEAGMHVLADKPWIIEPEDLPKLIATQEKASKTGLLLHDIMTERHEITSILQREIVDDPAIFGIIEPGDANSPGVFMESVHFLKKQVEYFCNNQVVFKLRDVHVRLDVLWDVETPPGGGDTHNAVFRGSRCSVVVRQAGGKLPELFVVPNSRNQQEVRDRLAMRVEKWQTAYPGIRLSNVGDEFQINIPDAYRTGHEAHFAEVTSEFLKYLSAPNTIPEWETPHLLAKYFITTGGVAFARKDSI